MNDIYSGQTFSQTLFFSSLLAWAFNRCAASICFVCVNHTRRVQANSDIKLCSTRRGQRRRIEKVIYCGARETSFFSLMELGSISALSMEKLQRIYRILKEEASASRDEDDDDVYAWLHHPFYGDFDGIVGTHMN